MTDHTKSFFKRLRSIHKEGSVEKKMEENASGNPSNNPAQPTNSSIPAPQEVKIAPRSVSTKIAGRRASFVDPLEYFNKEHLIVKPGNMEEYIYKPPEVIKEVDESQQKRKKTTAMPPKGGNSGKINFEEMLKVRQSLRSTTLSTKEARKPASVGARPGSLKPGDPKMAALDKKKSAQYEKNLYIKLVLAKNKYSQKSKTASGSNVYQEILTKIDELKNIKDMPPNLADEIDDMVGKLQLNDGMVVDEDVETVLSDEDDSDPVGINIVPLKDIIKKIKPELATN